MASSAGWGRRERWGRKEREEAERGSAQCQEYNSAPRRLGRRRCRRRPAACPGLRPDGAERARRARGGGGPSDSRGPAERAGVRRGLGGRCEGEERRKPVVKGAVTTPEGLARHVALAPVWSQEGAAT